MRKVIAAAACFTGAEASDKPKKMDATCKEMKGLYDTAACKGKPDEHSGHMFRPMAKFMKKLTKPNKCADTKPASGGAFDNFNCTLNNVIKAAEQAGTDVSKNYKGSRATNATPIASSLFQAGLCPVNVHWHLGAEHKSDGEYDQSFSTKGPAARRLATDKVRAGFRCKHHDGTTKFTKEYDWKHCVGMKVGETYEVHWPHSTMGDCGGVNQWQTPFYDGVFCNKDPLFTPGIAVNENVGVEAQVFTVVNDETFFYPNLMQGAISEGQMWKDVTRYTGSTTGTSRSNTVCSAYTPITWHVDRNCHMISASTFDKMCADMKMQRDDMSGDLHPHGARELVSDTLAADNHVTGRALRGQAEEKKMGFFQRLLESQVVDSDICPAKAGAATAAPAAAGNATTATTAAATGNATTADATAAKKDVTAKVDMDVTLDDACDTQAEMDAAACSATKTGLMTVMATSVLAGLKAVSAVTIVAADVEITAITLAARRALSESSSKRSLGAATMTVDYKVAGLAAADADALVADVKDTTKQTAFTAAVKTTTETEVASVAALASMTVTSVTNRPADVTGTAVATAAPAAGTSSAMSRSSASTLLVAMALSAVDMRLSVFSLFMNLVTGANAATSSMAVGQKCKDVKAMHDKTGCCAESKDDHLTGQQAVAFPTTMVGGKTNKCEGKKTDANNPLASLAANINCTVDGLANGVLKAVQQAGSDVTKDFVGGFSTSIATMITGDLRAKGLCPVNVHWHLGAEHRSAGQYDEKNDAKGPSKSARRLATDARLGFRCGLYDSADKAFTTEFDWKHCSGMHVGETYEVHWPHSALGDCGGPNQFQTPFYDGVFCNVPKDLPNGTKVEETVGVEAQIFTIVNDEDYFYPDLMWGAIKSEDLFWKEVTKYTGSTTGTSRSNTICSQYAPISWHVDRSCHKISASTFDKMCADMKMQRDDMSGDLHAHGARELVATKMSAKDHVFDKNDRVLPSTAAPR